ncbi:MAG: transposase, partial [Deltaproteobacteria bacterium]|nr:transposase [Deltaproteobacteria bacterium]
MSDRRCGRRPFIPTGSSALRWRPEPSSAAERLVGGHPLEAEDAAPHRQAQATSGRDSGVVADLEDLRLPGPVPRGDVELPLPFADRVVDDGGLHDARGRLAGGRAVDQQQERRAAGQAHEEREHGAPDERAEPGRGRPDADRHVRERRADDGEHEPAAGTQDEGLVADDAAHVAQRPAQDVRDDRRDGQTGDDADDQEAPEHAGLAVGVARDLHRRSRQRLQEPREGLEGREDDVGLELRVAADRTGESRVDRLRPHRDVRRSEGQELHHRLTQTGRREGLGDGALARLRLDVHLPVEGRAARLELSIEAHRLAVLIRGAFASQDDPHFHALALDGVYVEDAEAQLAFHALPRLRTDEVADVLQTVRIRVVNLLERRGLLEHADDAQIELCANESLADSEPALARLAHTAVGTEPPSGPEVRRRHADVSL